MNELPRFVISALVFIAKDDTILLSLPGGVVELGEWVNQEDI